MTKRARGATRPGQRRPATRVAVRPSERPASPEPMATTTAVAAESTSVTMTTGTSGPTREANRVRTRPSGAFSASAAQEYAYVGTDVRRIAKVGGAMFATMFVLYVLIEVVHIVRI